jgi:electron transport complex protein RnfC
MMGLAQTTLDVPVVKGTNAVLCLSEEMGDEATELKELCIHCGFCVQVCPMQLLPLYLYQAGQNDDRETMEAFFIRDCIECGCCAYICPGKIPLVHWIRKGKQRLREAKS